MMNDQQLLRFSRHILLDEIGIEGQEKLLAAHALVVGCGGLGAAALPYLAAAGIGRLTIADADTVDETNLQRQITFTEADIGKNKALVMQGRLKQINSQTHITAMAEFLDEARLVELANAADIILDCSDNYPTRQAVNRAAFATRTPLVSAAAVGFDGQIAVYRPDLPILLAMPACLTVNKPATALVHCSAFFRPWSALSERPKPPKRSKCCSVSVRRRTANFPPTTH